MAGYTPVFGSVFTGSLCGRYPDSAAWLILLALADKHGCVDVSPAYISSVTGMPERELVECIERFMQPDPNSRTTTDDGRRLELIDPARPWGWRIINHQKYRERARLQAKNAREVESNKNAERLRSRSVNDRRSPPETAADRRSSPTTPDNRPSNANANALSISGGKRPTDTEFQRFKAAYPKRAGGQRWQDARKGIRARLSEGHSFDEILNGARRYAAWCTRNDKIGTEYVMQAATFCGPNKAFEEEWKSEPGRAAPESTADVAARLGLNRGADESDEQFARRVGTALTTSMYSKNAVKS